MTQRAFKYRFYPTPEQESLLRRTIGCTRFVYNRALFARTEAWYERQERIGYAETSAMLTDCKKEDTLTFLTEISSVPLQQGLRHLQTAFTNFFAGRPKYPNFKKNHHGGSSEFTKSAFRWKDGQVYLAKSVEPLAIHCSSLLPKSVEPSTITVKLSPAGRWTVSQLVDVEIETLPESPDRVGRDMGITSLIALSASEKISHPKAFQAKRRKFRKSQKALIRKQKCSNNRYKACLKATKIYAEISDARLNFLHKLTTNLVRKNQTITVEDLAVKNMMKNHKIALRISNKSWGELITQLEYKCEWYGRRFVKIDRWFPSYRRCRNYGNIVDKLPLNTRKLDFPKCRASHDRDINSAINILVAGLAVSVCGVNVRPNRNTFVGQLVA